MRVLLMDSHPGAGETAAEVLREAGHEVLRCRDPLTPTQPCVGLDRMCPIDTEPIDVAMVVRARPLPRPTAGEQGVVCAARAGLPVVVAGQTLYHPFEKLATIELTSVREAVAACEAAIAAQEGAACDAIAASVAERIGAPVEVRRRPGDELEITVSSAIPGSPLAVTAHAVARAAARGVRTITVRAR